MKYVRLVCGECGKEFDKPKNEYNRRIKKGVEKFYCGRSCGMAASNKTCPRPGNLTTLIADNRRDEFSSFKWYLRRAKQRSHKKGETDLTLEYLKDLWEVQNHRCPITNWVLNLPPDSENWSEEVPFNTKSASLDRIDNTKGYIQGNVRYVSVMFNFARNKFTDEEVIKFAKAVVNHQGTLRKKIA